MKGEDDVNTARKDEEADGSGEFLMFLYSESWLRVYYWWILKIDMIMNRSVARIHSDNVFISNACL